MAFSHHIPICSLEVPTLGNCSSQIYAVDHLFTPSRLFKLLWRLEMPRISSLLWQEKLHEIPALQPDHSDWTTSMWPLCTTTYTFDTWLLPRTVICEVDKHSCFEVVLILNIYFIYECFSSRNLKFILYIEDDAPGCMYNTYAERIYFCITNQCQHTIAFSHIDQ